MQGTCNKATYYWVHATQCVAVSRFFCCGALYERSMPPPPLWHEICEDAISSLCHTLLSRLTGKRGALLCAKLAALASRQGSPRHVLLYPRLHSVPRVYLILPKAVVVLSVNLLLA